ncbi:MAG TPA: GNAT family protein [Polyangiaceae bacterium]|nr:GNAT family protein [Polyangiaceae bacterium]
MIHELGDVRLRLPEPSDIDALYRIKNDPELAALLGGHGRGYSRADLADWISSHRSRRDEVLWVVVDSASEQCIGHVGLYCIDHRVRKAEFGILLERGSWGRGLGRRLTSFAIEYGFRELALSRIELNLLASNARALKTYLACGFVEEGRLRRAQFKNGRFEDVVWMGLLADEYRATSS